jgi:hypothetical protein
MKSLFTALALATSAFVHAPLAGQTSLFSAAEIREDLHYLQQQLESNHPNLHIYHSPQEVRAWFAQKSDHLPDQITPLDAFLLISSVTEILQDGHSYIYPSQQHLTQFFESAPLFPLEVFSFGEDLVVTANFSDSSNIKVGAQLVEINGKTIAEIRTTILRGISGDGPNPGYPSHLLYQFFPAYYSFFFGFQDSFAIEYLSPEGIPKKETLAGIPRTQIRQQRTAEVDSSPCQGICLEIDQTSRIATLVIPTFDNTILKTKYGQKFKKEIRSAFQQLAEHGATQLVIDLRDNQGGELSNGIFLLQHFMTSPFKVVDSYHKVKSVSDSGQQGLKQMGSRWDRTFQPFRRNHFPGNVFLFTNGGSFSCSAIVANAFRVYERGLIVGEMTGGSAYTNTGAPNEEITLPNTQILVTIPKTRYQLRESLESIELGVPPDLPVQDSPARISGGLDPCQEAVRRYLNHQ